MARFTTVSNTTSVLHQSTAVSHKRRCIKIVDFYRIRVTLYGKFHRVLQHLSLHQTATQRIKLQVSAPILPYFSPPQFTCDMCELWLKLHFTFASIESSRHAFLDEPRYQRYCLLHQTRPQKQFALSSRVAICAPPYAVYVFLLFGLTLTTCLRIAPHVPQSPKVLDTPPPLRRRGPPSTCYNVQKSVPSDRNEVTDR